MCRTGTKSLFHVFIKKDTHSQKSYIVTICLQINQAIHLWFTMYVTFIFIFNQSGSKYYETRDTLLFSNSCETISAWYCIYILNIPRHRYILLFLLVFNLIPVIITWYAIILNHTFFCYFFLVFIKNCYIKVRYCHIYLSRLVRPQ